MMTEEEAKKKWCLLSMVDEDSYQKCLGSACMAWRWGPGAPILRHKKTGVERLGAGQAFNPNDEDCIHPRGDQGYCGLAGKDEK